MDEITIDQRGVALAAWHLRATGADLTGPTGRPCVVMGHGFGATRDAGLLPFAQRFAAAGIDVVVFDYRGYGASEGEARQHVDHRHHRADYHAAVARARALDGVDPDRVAVWGSSYSGGHVVAVAAADHRLAAVVSQGAAMDGLAALVEILRYAGPVQLLRLTAHALRDVAGALVGAPEHRVPVVGPPGSLAAITAADAEDGYRTIVGPTFRNEMAARGILGIPLNRPVLAAGRLTCPALFVIAGRDSIAPPSAVRSAAERARRGGAEVEVLELSCGHFDIYTGEPFETSVAAQVAFLQKALQPSRT